MKNNRFVALGLVPAFVLLTLFVAIPMIGSVFFSLFDYNPLRGNNVFLGLANYKRMFSDQVYITAIKNTLIFVIVTVGPLTLR